MLPTPLSPACGFRRTLYAWRFTAAPRGGGYVARRSRRCRFRRGPGMIRRPFPRRPAVPRPILLARPLMVRTMRGIAVLSKPAGKSGLPTARLRGFNGLEVAASEDALAFIPPPCGISPSRREWFQNLFFFQGVTPSIRRANPRSRCVEDAPRDRVGQASDTRVIHFQAKQRWTRVDKSTVRRTLPSASHSPFASSEVRGVARRVSASLDTNGEGGGYLSRLARSLSRSALSLMKPSASCWS